MDEYQGLSNPLVDGVFVADGKNTVVNPYVSQMQDMGEFIASLRRNVPAPDLGDIQQQDYMYDPNISFPDLLEQEGIKVRVTSGYRENSKTKQGRRSHHSELDEFGNSRAFDIVPIDGDFDNLRNQIYSNPRIVNWLRTHNIGILEEITPEVMNKTGATGKHFHVGPDRWAIQMSSNYINYNNSTQIQASSKSAGKTGTQRLKYVKNYLMQNFGLDSTHASALAGVWYAESGLNPSIKSKRDSGSGIAQWTGSRHKEFDKFYRQVFGKSSPGIRNTSLEEQIHVAIAEYKARRNNWNDFLRRTDLQGATDSVLRGYENGGGRLASVADIDRIYTRNGSGSYKKLMADRLAYAKQAL